MSYRDELSALQARVASLEEALAEARADGERGAVGRQNEIAELTIAKLQAEQRAAEAEARLSFVESSSEAERLARDAKHRADLAVAKAHQQRLEAELGREKEELELLRRLDPAAVLAWHVARADAAEHLAAKERGGPTAEDVVRAHPSEKARLEAEARARAERARLLEQGAKKLREAARRVAGRLAHVAPALREGVLLAALDCAECAATLEGARGEGIEAVDGREWIVRPVPEAARARFGDAPATCACGASYESGPDGLRIRLAARR